MLDPNVDRMAGEAANINEGGGEKEYPAEVKTPSGTSNVLRILDGSNSYCKALISWMMCDDDQVRSFTIENEHQGKGVLSRMLGDPDNFFRGGYLESKKGQFGKVNVHQAKDPILFKTMTEYWNPSYNGTGSCRPTTEFTFNSLHRNPEEDDTGRKFVWCDEKKHTKLMKYKKRAFKALKAVRDNCGEFTSYDIVFSKQGTGSDTFFSAMKADIGTQYNRVGDLTPAEKEYERYDLDYITRLSSANYVLTNLRNKISQIDAVMGTNYVAELEKQKAMEDEMYIEQQQGQGVVTGQPVPSHTASSTTQIVTPAVPSRIPMSTPTPTRIPINTAKDLFMEECGHCHQQIPAGLTVCPKCSGVLLLDCDVCHKPFSFSATKCPHCGQEYASPGATVPPKSATILDDDIPF